jgi:hypothetical protein
MIKNFNLFKESVDEESKIRKICKEYGIKNYTINDDSSIDVDGDVDLYDKNLDKIPLKFGRVSGRFLCNNNKLTSLEGCPKWVGEYFYCYKNELESLEFCPDYVGGDFNCVYNKLTSLEFCPKSISGKFSFNHNKLKSLKFCPEYVGGEFHCRSNKLTSLEYLPKYIGDYISFGNNKIWSFKGIPDNFRGRLSCIENPIYNIWKLFLTSKDIEFFNDCHIVREPETPDGLPIVVIERLNFFLETIGKDPVEKVDGYINI